MKSYLFDRYGGPEVISARHGNLPYITEDMLLVKVHASSVNPLDYKVRRGDLKLISGFKFPKPTGVDFAGEVVYVGQEIVGFQPYDKVYGMVTPIKQGSHADYVAISPENVAAKPSNMTFQEAAGIPAAGLTALQGLRDEGYIHKGMKVMINGASGGVGHYAVQIAKAYDTEVTAVCSTQHVEAVQGLGPDHLIDYEKEDLLYTRHTYDIIFDTAGTLAYSDAKHLLRPEGIFVTTEPAPANIAQSLYTRALESKKLKVVSLMADHIDLHFLKGLAENGHLKTLVDSVFPIEELSRAHERAEAGHVQGKIIVAATAFSKEQ